MGNLASQVSDFLSNEAPDQRDPRSLLQHRFHLYCTISQALLAGSFNPRRPPLPLELVRYIFRLAGLTIPAPHQTLRVDTPIFIHSSTGELVRKAWVATPPLTRARLAHLAGVKAETMSRHQGWVSRPEEGSWSWFELAILRASDDIGPISPTQDARSEDDNEIDWDIRPLNNIDAVAALDRIPTAFSGKRLSWLSHKHPVNSPSLRESQRHEGVYFGPEHELWSELKEGDAITVIACAQYPGWECIGESVQLEFEDFFEPGIFLEPQ